MIKVGSLVRVKKEYYEYYMVKFFNPKDLLLVIEENKYYTGFLNKPTDDPYFQEVEVVKDVAVYKLFFPNYRTYSWPDYQLEEVQ